MNVKTYLPQLLIIALAFFVIYLIFKFFPLGLAFVTVGAISAISANHSDDAVSRFLGILLGWLYPIGVVVTFIQEGILFGFMSIFFGIFLYSFAKRS